MIPDSKTLRERYSPKQLRELAPDRQLTMIRFSPCGKILAGSCVDGSVRRWDVTTATFAEQTSMKGHAGWVSAIAFHGDAKRLFSADTWGGLRAWPYLDKDPRPIWTINQAHAGWIRQVAVSPDGKSLATCGNDQKVRLFAVEDGKQQQELSGHNLDVFSIAFHPDGKSLVSGDLKGEVRQWNLANGKCERTFDASNLYKFDRLQDVGGVRCLAFNPAGTVLGCAGCEPTGGGFVEGSPATLLFDWGTGKLTHTLKFGNATDGFVFDMQLHAEGFVMGVTSGQPGTGKFFLHLPGEAQPFFLATNVANSHSLAVHPDGRCLVVAATNAASGGNGRPLDKNKEYPDNFSPLFIFELPKQS